VYSCRCHHSRACSAALPELKRVQGTGQRWTILSRKGRVTIGKGETGKESLWGRPGDLSIAIPDETTNR